MEFINVRQNKNVYGDGMLIDFKSDETVCRNITVRNNIFKCAGFPGIGHHGDCNHHNIIIENNIFEGPSGIWEKSRGYIFFRPMVYDVKVKSNAFIAPEESDSPNYGIIFESPDKSALIEENNSFIGKIDKKVICGC